MKEGFQAAKIDVSPHWARVRSNPRLITKILAKTQSLFTFIETTSVRENVPAGNYKAWGFIRSMCFTSW